VGELPVLLLPGTLCTGALFEHQISILRPLAPQVEVVQFTLESSVDEMARLAERSIPGNGGAAIIGFSMGGMVAMALARRNPDLISKLALLNTNAHAELPERHAARLQHLESARRHGIESLFRQHYLPRYLYGHEPAHQRLIIEMASEVGTNCFEAQINALATRPDSAKTLESIDCPTLILGSRQDELCPPSAHRAMNRLVNGSDLLILEECGHFSTLERADAVSNALVDWYLKD
jgi:pimeloyl-ACP methyl ester carboxylesterase